MDLEVEEELPTSTVEFRTQGTSVFKVEPRIVFNVVTWSG